MVEVLVLGPIEAVVDGVAVPIGSRTQRTVLAALARDPGRAVSYEQLADLVWGDEPPEDPASALKTHVSRLRTRLGDDVVTARPPGYALTLERDRVDLHRFEWEAVHAAAVDALDRALSLWRGMPFGELGDRPFFAGKVARLTELYAAARQRHALLLRGAGRFDEALAALETLVKEDPLREPAWIALLETLHAAGRKAHATAAARRYRDEVARIGLEPSERFTIVEHAIFTSAPKTPPGTTPASAPASVPAPLTALVGRERDLEHLTDVLGSRRIVTLVGPGGVGKSALALAAAHSAAGSFTDGAWVAPLAEVDDPGSVIAAIARAVGAPTTEPLERAVCEYLAGRHALLVLDDAEHVQAAAASAVKALVGGCSGLRVLATSRRPLGVPGEMVVAVAPLDAAAALQLFRERARDAGAALTADDDALAASVCERLDRLPLALEMAAGRLRGLGLEELAARLDARLGLLGSSRHMARHRTLGEVVAWSHDLLDRRQQTLLAQLSLFAGTFDLEGVEAVCEIGGDLPANLADLVDASLVQARRAGGTRYRLLETVRAFAAQKLDVSPANGQIAPRFVQHQAELAERVAEGLRGPDEARWAARFAEQTPNLEAAHRRALEAGDVGAAARLASAPYVLVHHRLRADVGAWAETTLPVMRERGHPLEPAVRAVAGLNHLHRGDPQGAAAVLADLPDEPVARHGHEVLADLCLYAGELDRSLDHARRAEALADIAGDRFTALYSRVGQTLALGYDGHADEALCLVVKTREDAAALDSPLLAGWLDYAEGELRAGEEPARALALLDGAVAAADAAGWSLLAGVGRLTASSVRARMSDPGEAVPAFARLIRHWDRLGDEPHQWTTLRNLVELLTRLGEHSAAARLLGAAATAPTPTYGPEQRRIADATDRLRHELGDDLGVLVEAGRTGGRDEAVAFALATLTRLARAA